MSEENKSEPQSYDMGQFHKILLEYVDNELQVDDDQLPEMVAFLMRDGSIKISVTSPFAVMLDIIEESRLSDRLLVIVSVAYLEDQLRLLLAKFLADDEETKKLLDSEGGPLPFIPLARLAFASGLIAKEWLEMLKEMANLRNKFAHKPAAQSFEDLKRDDKKRTEKSLNQIFKLYQQLAQKNLNEEPNENIHGKFGLVFSLMYALLQFSIDHRASEKPVQAFKFTEIIDVNIIIGYTRTSLQTLIDMASSRAST